MPIKKCIVVDLDNTLWGGVVGEDGMENLALSTKPPGAYFLAFQQALRDLNDRGVILAINSANNHDDAMNVIRNHPDMILKENSFAARRINWQDKAQNIRELAKELNIGLDSMVFLDDMPHQRENMRAQVPEVETPELPSDPAEYAKFLHSLSYFGSGAITDEDKMRANLYVTERLRKEAENSYGSKDEYLKSLGLELHFFENDPAAIARLSQLTGKTNQFNVKKRSLAEEQIRTYMDSKTHGVFHGRAVDRFGDHGIIVFALVRKGVRIWRLEQLLMSCRVMGRGIEDMFVAEIASRAAQAGAGVLSIEYKESEKNEPARTFVERVFGRERKVKNHAIIRPDWITVV